MVNASRPRRSSLARLLQIVVELQGDHTPNSRQLAKICEVSRRTIFRDLETIERAGLLIEYDAARMGYRLKAKLEFPHSPVDERDVIALYLLSQTWDKPDEAGLIERAKNGILTLIQNLSQTRRNRIQAICPTLSDHPTLAFDSIEPLSIFDQLIEGILRGVCLEVGIRKSNGTILPSLTVTPYRLYYDAGWRLICRLSDSRDIREIAVKSVEKVIITEEPAVIPARMPMILSRRIRAEKPTTEVTLRLEPDVIASFLIAGWTPLDRTEPVEGGCVNLRVAVDRPEAFVFWCLGHGDRVEVLCPESFRRKMKEAAQKIVQRYAEDEIQAVSTENESETGQCDVA